MKIPSRLKIYAHDYEVQFVDCEAIDDGVAEQNHARNTIKIRGDMPETQKEVCLFHEIIHALNTELSEKETEWLAQTLYMVLKENKLLK